MKQLLKSPKFLIFLASAAVLLPVLWLLAVGLTLPAGESLRIVQETPLSSPAKAGLALLVTPALLFLDFILLASASFLVYTLITNIVPLLKKEIGFSWFIQIVLVASLSTSFTWYAVKETPRLLFDFTGINVPFHRVIAGPEKKLYLVHDLLGVRKSFDGPPLYAIRAECSRTDQLEGKRYVIHYSFQIGLEIGPEIYLTREVEALPGTNPQYAAYLEMTRLAQKTGARLELKKCPHIEEFPPGLYIGETITGKEPWEPGSPLEKPL